MAQWWERSPTTNVAWVRFQLGVIRALGLLLVPASLPEFSPGFPVFLHLKRTSTSNFQSDQDRRSVWKPAKVDVASSLKIVFFSNPSLSLLKSCQQCPTIQSVVPYRLMTNKQADTGEKSENNNEQEWKKSRKIETSININRNDQFLQSKRYQNPI